MAKLPALVTALAEVDGRDRATIDHYARVVREAGYIPTTKRGSGAAEMTAREAANLLIAVCGTDSSKDAPLAIDRFRSLRRHWATDNWDGISTAETFGEALEDLIESAAKIAASFLVYVNEAYPDRSDEARAALWQTVITPGGLSLPVSLEIRFGRYAADIVCATRQRDGFRTEWETHFIPDTERTLAGFYGEKRRRVSVTIDLADLLTLWRVLNPDTPDPEIAGEELEVARLDGAPGPEKETDS